MTALTETIPPPRAQRWPLVLGVLVLFGALVLLNALRAWEAHRLDQLAATFDYFWSRLGAAVVTFAVVSWLIYRPSRVLMRKLRQSGIDSPVPIYSSRDLEQAIKAINGVVVGSHSTPRTAFLAFVDGGPTFEIWRLHRGQPQCVARARWQQVASIGMDTVNHLTTVDRAIVLNVPKNGRTVGLPISPQSLHLGRMRPVKDAEFRATLRDFRMRLETHRPSQNQ